MKPRVIYRDGWWRVFHAQNPYPVAVYGTWERAITFANQITEKAKA